MTVQPCIQSNDAELSVFQFFSRDRFKNLGYRTEEAHRAAMVLRDFARERNIASMRDFVALRDYGSPPETWIPGVGSKRAQMVTRALTSAGLLAEQ